MNQIWWEASLGNGDSSVRKSSGWLLLRPDKGQKSVKFGNPNTLIFDIQHPWDMVCIACA